MLRHRGVDLDGSNEVWSSVAHVSGVRPLPAPPPPRRLPPPQGKAEWAAARDTWQAELSRKYPSPQPRCARSARAGRTRPVSADPRTVASTERVEAEQPTSPLEALRPPPEDGQRLPQPPKGILFVWQDPYQLLQGIANGNLSWGSKEQSLLQGYAQRVSGKQHRERAPAVATEAGSVCDGPQPPCATAARPSRPTGARPASARPASARPASARPASTRRGVRPPSAPSPRARPAQSGWHERLYPKPTPSEPEPAPAPRPSALTARPALETEEVQFAALRATLLADVQCGLALSAEQTAVHRAFSHLDQIYARKPGPTELAAVSSSPEVAHGAGGRVLTESEVTDLRRAEEAWRPLARQAMKRVREAGVDYRSNVLREIFARERAATRQRAASIELERKREADARAAAAKECAHSRQEARNRAAIAAYREELHGEGQRVLSQLEDLGYSRERLTSVPGAMAAALQSMTAAPAHIVRKLESGHCLSAAELEQLKLRMKLVEGKLLTSEELIQLYRASRAHRRPSSAAPTPPPLPRGATARRLRGTYGTATPAAAQESAAATGAASSPPASSPLTRGDAAAAAVNQVQRGHVLSASELEVLRTAARAQSRGS